MALVFVSYSRKDQAFVLRLVSDLRNKGIPIWLDQTDITPGKPWDVAIENALEAASHFLLVVSQSSVQSSNVRDELNTALDDHKEVIPILIEDCKLPLRIRSIQYTDFREDYDTALPRLIQVLPVEAKDSAASKPDALSTGFDASEVKSIFSQLEDHFRKSTRNPIEILHDPHSKWYQVVNAIKQLSESGDPSIVTVLEEFIDHPEADVRQAARQGIAVFKNPNVQQENCEAEKTDDPIAEGPTPTENLTHLKIIIAGPKGAGKTAFIKSLCQTESDVEDILPVKEPSVDFGRLTVDNDLLIHLFGVPHNPRHRSAWKIIANGMSGFIVMVNSARPETFLEARFMLETFKKYATVPYVVAANNQSDATIWVPEDIGIALGVENNIKIIPCVATDYEAVKKVMVELLYLILEDRDSQGE